MVRQVVLAVVILGSAVAAEAQPPAEAPERRGGPGRAERDAAVLPDALPDAALADMLDTYAIVQAQRELTIADDKYGVFAARLKKLQDTRRRNQRQRQQLGRQLDRK